MNILSNTRRWSTPAIIGAGLFVSVSGVLMFAGIHNPIKLAHEWIGLLFAVTIFLHLLNHWTAFKNYFSKRLAISIVTLVLVASSVFISLSMTDQGGGNVIRSLVRSFETSPLTEVSLILNAEPQSLVSKFETAGYHVEKVGMSIKEIAKANNSEPRELIHLLFD